MGSGTSFDDRAEEIDADDQTPGPIWFASDGPRGAEPIGPRP